MRTRQGRRTAGTVAGFGRLALGLAAAVAGGVPAAHAAEDLGAQRVATSMLTFLKIGVGARAVALGEAFVTVADDATTLHWNPAGIADLAGPRVHVTHTSWPADISYDNAIYVQPTGAWGGGFGLHVASLRTTLDYTTEAEPLPSGRTFGYSDLLLGGAYSRQFTDRFTLGVGLKYLREDLVRTWAAASCTPGAWTWGRCSGCRTAASACRWRGPISAPTSSRRAVTRAWVRIRPR
jgi:hypothetical protein